jgi:hypothetical protein
MPYNLILNSNNVIGSNNTTFRYNFIQGALTIPENSKICVSQIVIPYSFFNLNLGLYNNTSIRFTFSGTTYNYVYPNGFYTTADLNQALQLYMISQGLYLYDTTRSQNVYYIQIITNPTYYANTIYCYPVPSSLPSGFTDPTGLFPFSALTRTPQVQFPTNLSSILGFSKAVYYPPALQSTGYSINSTITPNATPINSIIVRCSLVNNSCTVPTDILDSFTPNVNFGSNITYTPNYEKWIEANSGVFSSFDLTFTDQNFNVIQSQDSNVLINLLITTGDRKKKIIIDTTNKEQVKHIQPLFSNEDI